MNIQRQATVGRNLMELGMSIHAGEDIATNTAEVLFDYGAELVKGTMNNAGAAPVAVPKVKGGGGTVGVVMVGPTAKRRAHTRRLRSNGTTIVDQAPSSSGGKNVKRMKTLKKPTSRAAVRYGDTLWEYRKKFGLTQIQAAALVPFHGSTWSTVESGSGNPTVENRSRLDEVLTVTPSQAALQLVAMKEAKWTSLNKKNN